MSSKGSIYPVPHATKTGAFLGSIQVVQFKEMKASKQKLYINQILIHRFLYQYPALTRKIRLNKSQLPVTFL